jgi:hypothetical protein
VCGLAHDLERQGLSTTLIGLIGRHVALMRPPRAMVVPFELGRPFGAPEEPDFQRRVLADAIRLLARTDGPIMTDFPYDPPPPRAGLPPWVPPIERAPSNTAFASALEHASGLRAEIAQLRPANDDWVRQGGRRLDRITGMGSEEIVARIIDYKFDRMIESPMAGYPPHLALKFAADDLKHFYYQAALARPARVTDVEIDDWFFDDTLAGRLIVALKEALMNSDDEAVRNFAATSFVRAR